MPTSTPPSRWIANPTYDDYQRAALVAFEAREVQQCVEQLAAALSLNPQGMRARALADQLCDAYPDLVSKLPRSGEAFFGVVAFRALIVSRHDVVEALGLLEEVVAFRPTVPFLQWLEGGRFAAVDMQAIAEGVARICRSLMVAKPATAEEVKGFHSNVRSLAVVAQRLREQGPPHSVTLDVAVLCIAKLGHEPVFIPPWLGSVTSQNVDLLLGQSRLALRERRYPDAANLALRAFADGPVLPAGRELTLQLIEAGAFAEARRVVERLQAEPSSKDWAEAHLDFVEALTGNVEASCRLRMRAERQTHVAIALFKEIGVYRTHLPDPFDVASASVRRLLKSAASSEGETFNVDARGQAVCPSASLAYQEGLNQLDLKGVMTLGSGTVSTVPHTPWKVTCSGLVEADRLPVHAAVVERIRTIAESPFELEVWALSAASVRQLEHDDIEAEVLACLGGISQQGSLHPVAWLFRVQVASALALAALVTNTDSRPAQLLAELVGAASDWSSAAAALALGYLGQTHPEYEWWARSTLDSVLAGGVLPSTAAEHAIIVARSWFERDGGESFAQLWSRRMKLVQR